MLIYFFLLPAVPYNNISRVLSEGGSRVQLICIDNMSILPLLVSL